MSESKHVIEKRVNAFKDACERFGLRLTHQRIEIFRELARAEDHPSAETIYSRVRKRIPTMSLDTVYRTLNTFEEYQLISRVGVLNGRAKFEANVEPHHHFICKDCGNIFDIFSKEAERIRLVKDLPEGFVVHSASVELRGICRDCSTKSN